MVQVAQVSYKDTKGWRDNSSSFVQVKEEAVAADEAEALEATGHEHGTGCRRRSGAHLFPFCHVFPCLDYILSAAAGAAVSLP